MNYQLNKKIFTNILGIVGAIATAMFIGFPGLASEQNNAEITNQCATKTDNCVPVKPDTFVCLNNSDPRCGNPPGNARNIALVPGSFACINNPNPACGNPPGNFHASDLKPGSFACINNSNPVCRNPISYEICP